MFLLCVLCLFFQIKAVLLFFLYFVFYNRIFYAQKPYDFCLLKRMKNFFSAKEIKQLTHSCSFLISPPLQNPKNVKKIFCGRPGEFFFVTRVSGNKTIFFATYHTESLEFPDKKFLLRHSFTLLVLEVRVF